MRKILLSIACLLAITVKADNINVGTQEELAALSADNHTDDVITLTADIALTFGSGEYWTPIGTFSTPFEGTFDGNGHTISGIIIDYESGEGLAGLFGYVGASGVIKNVVVAGEDYIYSNGDGTNTNYVGAIAGYNEGTIQNCGNTALVSAFHKNGRAGGVVGYNTGAITGCYNLGTVERSGTDVFTIYIGGIVGENDGGTVSSCMSTSGITPDMTLENSSSNASTLTSHNSDFVNVLLDSRMLYADGSWNTLCLPFTIPAAALAGATVKEIDAERSGLSGTTLTLYANIVTTLTAGKPYLVKWPADKPDITNPCFQGVSISITTTDAVFTGGRFTGSFSPVSFDANDKTVLFVGNNNQLHWPSSSITMGSCRAYFLITEGMEAREIVTHFDDEETTEIETMSEVKCLMSDAWYDMQGRKFPGKPTTKGIYIHNGKRKVVK